MKMTLIQGDITQSIRWLPQNYPMPRMHERFTLSDVTRFPQNEHRILDGFVQSVEWFVDVAGEVEVVLHLRPLGEASTMNVADMVAQTIR